MKMKQADVESLLRTGLTSQLNLIDQLRNESSNTDTMDQRMIDRANELISTYSDMGASATKTFLTVQSALMNEFGESAKQSSKYWAIMNDYVVENINQRDKLTALDKKYAPFSPKEKTERCITSRGSGYGTINTSRIIGFRKKGCHKCPAKRNRSLVTTKKERIDRGSTGRTRR